MQSLEFRSSAHSVDNLSEEKFTLFDRTRLLPDETTLLRCICYLL